MSSPLEVSDPDIFSAIRNETRRQTDGLELIASENFVSEAVLEALGSTLTNKYAEGLPGKRYYGGCEVVDVVETCAISRARTVFAAEAANVQPHSGAQANMAVYFTVLKPGDTFVAMSLNEGGHLTHGAQVNYSGRLYRPMFYGVDPKSHRIDYDQVRDLVKSHQPKLLVAGASSYPRIIDYAIFGSIAREAGIKLMVDMAHVAGLVAANEHPSPVPHADFVTTTTHKTLRGPRGGLILMREAEAKGINSSVFPGMQGGPLMHVIAAKAVALKEAAETSFAAYQKRVRSNAATLAGEFLERGYNLVSGGTDNHLILIDLRNRNISGKDAERLLGEAGITVNKNMIPQDPTSPFVTSGIRIGTPALTTRGMGEGEMKQVVGLMDRILAQPGNESVSKTVRGEVLELTARFPLYATRRI